MGEVCSGYDITVVVMSQTYLDATVAPQTDPVVLVVLQTDPDVLVMPQTDPEVVIMPQVDRAATLMPQMEVLSVHNFPESASLPWESNLRDTRWLTSLIVQFGGQRRRLSARPRCTHNRIR